MRKDYNRQITSPLLTARYSSGPCFGSQRILCFQPFCDKGYGYRGNGLGRRLISQAEVKPGAEEQEKDKGNLLTLLHNSLCRNRVGRAQPLGQGCWEILTDKPLRIQYPVVSVCTCIRVCVSENNLACVEEREIN